VRKRAARMGRNPMTGEAIKIKASRKVAFRAAKDLKMAIWTACRYQFAKPRRSPAGFLFGTMPGEPVEQESGLQRCWRRVTCCWIF